MPWHVEDYIYNTIRHYWRGAVVRHVKSPVSVSPIPWLGLFVIGATVRPIPLSHYRKCFLTRNNERPDQWKILPDASLKI